MPMMGVIFFVNQIIASAANHRDCSPRVSHLSSKRPAVGRSVISRASEKHRYIYAPHGNEICKLFSSRSS